MRIKISFGAAKQTKWHQYVMRFVFGGTVTALTGIVAKLFGPEIGGLFLAFPAIFPASASLIEKHQRKKKQRAGLDGARRGRIAAGLDAAGATVGTIGLLFFGLLVWKLLPGGSSPIILIAATAVWLFSSLLGWYIWRKA